MNPPTLWELSRPRSFSWLIAAQLLASTVTTVLSFATAILAIRFWTVDDFTDGYRILAVALVALLVVPLLTLGTAAARLAARSRDERLSTLRLLGVSSRDVRRVAILETTIIQAAGVVLGALLALALPLLLSAVPVHGETAHAADLWLPAWASALIVVALIAFAAVSALLGLRRVTLTPLGVRQRTDAPRLSPVRLLVAAVAIVGSIVLLQFASPSWGTTGLVCAIGGAVLVVMGVLNLAGPFAVDLLARIRVRTTSDPAVLVAARRNLGDPRAAWREVSSVALTSFLLVPAGSMLGFLHAVQTGSTVLTSAQMQLFTDARTMLMALVAVSFVVAACQVVITQASALLENCDLYVALDRIGMPVATMNRARRRQTTGPVLIAVIGSAVASTALTVPLVLVAATNSPVFLATTLLILTAGVVLVRVAIRTTDPLLMRVLRGASREE